MKGDRSCLVVHGPINELAQNVFLDCLFQSQTIDNLVLKTNVSSESKAQLGLE
jgi:hypothetical protein